MAVDPLVVKLIRDFWFEAQEHVEAITRDLLQLEQVGEAELARQRYEAVARRLHTLKGSAATLGLKTLAELAHAMEELLLPLRGGANALPRAAADALLEALDTFLASIRVASAGEHDPASLPVDGALRLLSSVQGAGDRAPAVTEEATELEAPRLANEQRTQASDDAQNDAWRVDAVQVMALMRDVERVREVRLRMEERRRDLRAVIGRLSSVLAPEIGELRAALEGLEDGLAADGEDAGDTVSSLEDGLKAICTLPARSVLDALPRAVRDVARQLGKEASLSVVGGEVSLDRRLLEALRGPLVHLVRNAVVHGIEAPLEREQLGKHREGAVVVRVEQAGNRVFLSVEDDGRGIDGERVRAAAQRKGLITLEQAQAMSAHELEELIFRPGFSTLDEATQSSGRGVGLDVVRRQVDLLEGRLDVETRLGQGTRFVITLPMQLGSSPVLVVRAGEHSFGLPLLALELGIALRENALVGARSQARIELGGALVPLLDLGVMLGLRGAWQPSRGQPLIVVRSAGKKVAVAVDEVGGDMELVIRSLPLEVRAVPAFQGAALVAHGDLLLILSPGWLVEQSHERLDERVSQRKRRALVIDDSLTARAMYRTILEAGGYAVQSAGSREEALQQLVHGPFDVIMVDIVLGSDDGVALVRTLRARPETRACPLILISAQDGPSERQRGMAAGASLFLGKWECSSTRLLEAVDSLLERRQAS